MKQGAMTATIGRSQPYAKRWWVLGVMSLSLAMVMVDNTVVNTALPSIARDLRATTSTLQWVVDGYILMLAGLMLMGGTLGDRFGRRRLLVIGMCTFGAASVGSALAPDAETLIVTRGAQGVGAALVLPATLSIITHVFPREERSKAIGIWTGVGAIGIAVGPLLGGWLVDSINWSAVFWMHLPVVALSLLGMRIVPESRDSRRLPLDFPGVVAGTGGLLALVYALIQGGATGWTEPQIAVAFAVAAVLLGAFVAVERRSAAPMLPLHFFKRRDFSGSVLVIALIVFAMLGVFFFLTLYFQLVQGKSAFQAGLFILPAVGMLMVAAPLAGVLNKRVGPRVLAIVATAVILFGMVWLAQLEVDSSYLLVAIGLMTFGFGAGMAMAPLTDTVMAAVPVNDAGIGSAINNVGRELGAALGIAILGSIVTGMYRSNVEEALAGAVPARIVEDVSEGIGVAVVTARDLPATQATVVLDAANTAFVEAISAGFYIGAGFIGAALLVAVTMVPGKMRTHQAVEEEAVAAAARADGDVAGAADADLERSLGG